MNELIYNGKNSRDFGIYISGEGTFNSPERDAETISIPGKNGDLEVSHNRFKNISVEYPAFIVRNFKDNAAAARAWLLAASGYHRLEDTYHIEYFRLGRFTGPIDFDMKFLNRAGEFKLAFDCKPQRFLKSGEEIITTQVATKSASGNLVTITANENGLKSIKLYGKTTQTGTGDPSPTNIRPISGISASISANGAVYAPSAPIKLYGQNEVYDTWEPCVMVDGVLRSRLTQRFGCSALDGTENIVLHSVSASGYAHFYFPYGDYGEIKACSHYQNKSLWATPNTIYFDTSLNHVYATITDYTTADMWKSYLAAQKSAGTPVTFVHQLAAPIVTLGDPYTIPNAAGDVTISAENTVDVTYESLENGCIYNPTEFTALPLIRVYGTAAGTLTVGNTVVKIKSITEYVDLDCELQDAFKGITNCNGNVYAPDFPTLPPGGTGISFSGGITKIEIKPRWWTV